MLATTVGTVCLLLMFELSGIHKALNYTSTVASLAKKAEYIPIPHVAIGLVVLLEVAAPLVVVGHVVSDRFRLAALASVGALIVFTVAATLIYHPFRAGSYMKNLPLLSNLSVVGGLVLLMAILR